MAEAPQGVLLDVDGTLVDSNGLHARAWVEALAEQGIDVAFADVRRAVGMGGDKLLPAVAHIEKGSPQGEAASKRRGEIFRSKYLPQVQPFPDVRPLLQHMKDEGLTLTVASSSDEEEVQALLKLADVDKLVDALVTSKDAKQSKPAPALVEIALQKSGLTPEQALMLGDTPYDIEAAAKAGVRTLALRCGGWGDTDLKNALAIYDNPADLLARFAQPPLGTIGNNHE